MKIGAIQGQMPNLHKMENTHKKNVDGFGDMFTDFVKDVNSSQLNSVKATEEFVAGGDIELHEVMIAGQKAKTNLELLMQIRNKAMDMYNQITRMQ